MLVADMAFLGREISPNQIETHDGFIIAHNVSMSRTGVQEYLGRELGMMDRANEIIKVYRLAEDVFAEEAMRSFEGKPFTNDHPPEMVGPSNYNQFGKGHIQNVRRDGIYQVVDVFAKTQDVINDMQNGKRQVSAGYFCEYVPYKDGFKQINIRGNHLSLVAKGRAGDKVIIRDHQPNEDNSVTYTAEQVAQLLNAQAAKDTATATAPNQTNDTILSKLLDHLLGKSAKPVRDEDEDEDKKDKDKKKDDKDKESKDQALDARLKSIEDSLKALAAKDDESDVSEAEEDVEEAVEDLIEEVEETAEEKQETSDRAYKMATDALKDVLPTLSPAKQKEVKDSLRKKFGKPTGVEAYKGVQAAMKKSAKDSANQVASKDASNIDYWSKRAADIAKKNEFKG
jgi:hypothetical protein